MRGLPCKSRKPRENLRSEKSFQMGLGGGLSLRGGFRDYTSTGTKRPPKNGKKKENIFVEKNLGEKKCFRIFPRGE